MGRSVAESPYPWRVSILLLMHFNKYSTVEVTVSAESFEKIEYSSLSFTGFQQIQQKLRV